ncbi:hypothetical protein Pla52o_31460 [Novipirellula galeiformis]|uniref:DUF3311 domain-containing protein n=1 Tax=Novipirellula galeiformis TaxID=2528004 RepID=A0A5C6CCZ9_9BACT|nr:DUF3311 domain-containing protein [Novipirellula galeiformis]TWU22098.1 hypothetical protein Pla52o_31460 [Novipirellula galeiformis]
MKYIVWGLILFLVVIHQDVWNWGNDRLVLGFIPFTLAYHAGISIAASVVWFMAVTFIWPQHLEDEVEASTDTEEGAV